MSVRGGETYKISNWKDDQQQRPSTWIQCCRRGDIQNKQLTRGSEKAETTTLCPICAPDSWVRVKRVSPSIVCGTRLSISRWFESDNENLDFEITWQYRRAHVLSSSATCCSSCSGKNASTTCVIHSIQKVWKTKRGLRCRIGEWDQFIISMRFECLNVFESVLTLSCLSLKMLRPAPPADKRNQGGSKLKYFEWHIYFMTLWTYILCTYLLWMTYTYTSIRTYRMNEPILVVWVNRLHGSIFHSYLAWCGIGPWMQAPWDEPPCWRAGSPYPPPWSTDKHINQISIHLLYMVVVLSATLIDRKAPNDKDKCLHTWTYMYIQTYI